MKPLLSSTQSLVEDLMGPGGIWQRVLPGQSQDRKGYGSRQGPLYVFGASLIKHKKAFYD